MIEADKLSFKYNRKKQCLCDIEFKVQAGERIILFGADDAGKTTLLNLIMGFERKYSGDIWVFDKEPSKFTKDDMEKIRFVPDNIIMEEKLSAADYFRWAKSVTKRFDCNIVDELCTEFDIDISEKLMEMTFRDNKMVQIIAALCVQPKLLVLDEPCNFLDDETTTKLFKRIKLLSKKMTVIVACENFEDIEGFATGYAYLKDGRIVEQRKINPEYIPWKAVTVRGSITDRFAGKMDKLISERSNNGAGEKVFLYKGEMTELAEALVSAKCSDWTVENLRLSEQLDMDFSRWE